MQSDIYVDKDYDKASHRAIKHSETHVFLKFCGDVFINISQVEYQMGLSRNAQLYYGLTLMRAETLVQWLKLPAWNVGDRGFEAHSVLQENKTFPSPYLVKI